MNRIIIVELLPVVTRFLWPPEIPLIMSFPTMISAHMSNPNICKLYKQEKLETKKPQVLSLLLIIKKTHFPI